MYKTKLIPVLLVVVFVLTLSGISFAQEWSAEQKEPWKVVENMWETWANRDVDGYMNCLHKDFSGWFQKDRVPLNKKSLNKWETYNLNSGKVLIYEIWPVSITVSSQVAVVHYYATHVIENEKGKNKSMSKWTEVLVKENGKWLIISSHGGRVSD